MKKVDPKRLLPSGPSKGSSSLVATNFLVPASNITTKTYAKVDDDIKTPQQQDLKEQTTSLKNKFILAEKLFGEKTNLEKRKTQKQRVEKERERRSKKEQEIESRTFKFGGKLPTLRLPRTGFLDTIRRFVLYSVLGLAVDRIIPIIPKLTSLAKKITPVLQFFTNTVGNIVKNTAEFIDRGYKAADFLKEKVDNILPEGYQKTFDTFTDNLTEVISGTLLVAGAILGLKGGTPNAIKEALRGGGSLASGIESSKKYFSRYSFRTVKDTTPAFKTRVSNMLLRGSMNLPRAKELSTREALKIPAYATASRKSAAIAKTIIVGSEEVNTLRKAGVGTLTPSQQSEINSVKRKIGKQLGLTDRQISNAFVTRDLYAPKPKVKKPKTLSSTQVLGQTFSSEIARIKTTLRKLGYQPSELIRIANDADGQDYFTRKAAYDILVKQGKADRVFNIPTLGLPRPADRVAKVAEPTTFEKYIRKMQESGRPVDPMLTGAAGDRAAQRAGALEPEELVGGKQTPPIKRRTGLGAPETAQVLNRSIRRGRRRLAVGAIRAGRGATRLLGKVPIIGPLIDFAFNVLAGDSPTRAAAGAAGAAAGAALGSAIGSVIPLAGTLLGGIGGGILGDILGKSLYDSVLQIMNKKKATEEQKKFMKSIFGTDEEEKPKPFSFPSPGGPTVIDQSGLPALPPTNTIPGQNYGAPRDGGTRKHAGVDFDAGPNDTFYSRIGGKVIKIGVDPGGYGNYVDIYNKDLNVVERIAEGDYNHVRLGDMVQPGDAIQTGTSQTGVFHYEIRKGSTSSFGFQGTVNPIDFLNRISKSKKQANISKPNKSGDIASLTTTPDYGDGQTNVIIVPTTTVVNDPIVASSGGGGGSLNSSNTSSIFASSLVG